MIIKCEDIIKTYKMKYYSTQVFNDASIEIKQGDFVGITGRSGSGKTTLLNILGFLDTPDGGRYCFNGENVDFKNVRKLNTLRRKNVAFVRQDYGLIDEYDVAYNISLPLKYLRKTSDEIGIEVERVAALLDIEDKLRQLPSHLSGGECQRVAIARALINHPLVLLADEPTGSLDVDNENNVLNIFKEINSAGTTIVLVTHNNDIAEKCDAIFSIQKGKIVKVKGEGML